MTQIVLFHSVLGVRPGVHAAADLLRSHGHDVRIVDQYGGRVFDDYDEASAFAEWLGFPALMAGAVEGVADLKDDLVVMGFSNGGGMAQFVATQRTGVRAAVLLSGAIDLAVLGGAAWPQGVPAQVHYTVDDPFRLEEWVRAAVDAVAAAGGAVEQWDYPGSGHLFTDQSRPMEYQQVEASLLWSRVLPFIEEVDRAV